MPNLIGDIFSLGRGIKINTAGSSLSKSDGTISKYRFLLFLLLLLLYLAPSVALALGGGGWSNTRIKIEHQYTDYNSYKYPPPIPPQYPETKWLQYDPYIADFPEKRTLIRLTQAFSPTDVLQVRYQYSDLTYDKKQYLGFVQFAHDVHPQLNLYANYQYLAQPNWQKGWITTIGARYNQSGWIIAEFETGYNRNSVNEIITDISGTHPVPGTEHTIETYTPMASVRYAFDEKTAASLRWEGSFSTGSADAFDSYALILTLSWYLPSQTALHILCRSFNSSVGIHSISPSIEIAQYIRWNLTARLTYRYYENTFDNPSTMVNIANGSVQSHAFTLWSEYQVRADLKLHLKLRRYESNQAIKMNTYLLGLELTL